MATKAQKLRGQVRISMEYNKPWHGFTLQRGHFFGQTNSGVYFVSGLDRRADGRIKVYLCATNLHGISADEYKWTTHWVKPNTAIVKMLLEAVPRRKAMGIERIEFKPLEKQTTGYNPQLVTEKPYPYTPMRIPCAGKGQTSHLRLSK